MELFLLDNGLMEQEMVLVHKCGPMVQNTKDSGYKIKLMVWVSYAMLTVIFTKVTGLMTKLKGKELTLMLMVHIIMEIGLMINNMEVAWNLGLMVQNMKVTIVMEKKKEMES